MKISLFARELSMGGIERCATTLARELVQRGHQVRIVLLGGSQNLWADKLAGVEVCDISPLWRQKRWWAWAAEARRLSQDADVILASTYLMPLYMAWFVSRSSGQRMVGWIHGPLAWIDESMHMNPVHRHACQWIYSRLEEVVSVSKDSLDSLATWIGQPPKPKWRVIPNFAESSFDRQAAEGGDLLRLLFVGRFVEEKRPLLLVDLLAELGRRGIPAHLRMVGNGHLEDQTRQHVASLGLSEHVTFEGYHAKVEPFYAEADILLLPSFLEGCPMVVLEAMRAGLPVLTTDGGGTRELLVPMDNYLFAEDATPAAMADKLLAIRGQLPELRAWMKKRSENFTVETFVDRWLAVLEGR